MRFGTFFSEAMILLSKEKAKLLLFFGVMILTVLKKL
jgi:hypothetical protein